MNQRRGKINIEDGAEEHKMYEQSQNKEEQHIQCDQLVFEEKERKVSNMKYLNNTVRQYAINCQDQVHGSVFQVSL